MRFFASILPFNVDSLLSVVTMTEIAAIGSENLNRNCVPETSAMTVKL